MNEPAILPKLQANEREHHARTYAVIKAEEVAAEIVGMVIARTDAEISDPSKIVVAEQDIKRRLTALLRNSLVEFVDMYTRELEHRAQLWQQLSEDCMARVPAPPVVIPKKETV